MNIDKLHKNDAFSIKLEDLLDNQQDYPHLKLILSRTGIIKDGIGKKYLMVTPSSFGIVKLLDIDFNGEYIILSLQDCTDGIQRYLPININDTSFNYVLIHWQDIEDIAVKEILSNAEDDDTLEFNF